MNYISDLIISKNGGLRNRSNRNSRNKLYKFREGEKGERSLRWFKKRFNVLEAKTKPGNKRIKIR